MTVSPTDQLGKTVVATPGYASFAPVAGYVLQAPSRHTTGTSTWEFRRWRHRSSPTAAWQEPPAGQRALSVPTIGADDDTAVAVYRDRVPGAVAPYGIGCPGSGGRIPDHFSPTSPEIGQPASHNLRDALPGAATFLFVGLSRTVWRQFTLPLGLAFAGADPRCSVLAAGTIVEQSSTGAAGTASVTFPLPNDPGLIGARFFTQYFVVDPGLPTALKAPPATRSNRPSADCADATPGRSRRPEPLSLEVRVLADELHDAPAPHGLDRHAIGQAQSTLARLAAPSLAGRVQRLVDPCDLAGRQNVVAPRVDRFESQTSLDQGPALVHDVTGREQPPRLVARALERAPRLAMERVGASEQRIEPRRVHEHGLHGRGFGSATASANHRSCDFRSSTDLAENRPATSSTASSSTRALAR